MAQPPVWDSTSVVAFPTTPNGSRCVTRIGGICDASRTYNSPMSDPYQLPVGSSHWPIRVRPDQVLNLPRTPTTTSPRDLIRDALEHPAGFEPLRRALTPD